MRVSVHPLYSSSRDQLQPAGAWSGMSTSALGALHEWVDLAIAFDKKETKM